MYTAAWRISIAGKDTLLEERASALRDAGFEMRKMQRCAGYPKQKERITSNITRVATKYPRIAKMYYDEKGRD